MTALAPVFSRRSQSAPNPPARPAVEPLVVAVDSSPVSRAAIEEAVVLAAELDAPIVFVYVRRPARFVGAPFYQRRLSKEMDKARRVLDRALRLAIVAEVEAEAEILEGSPRRRIVEFARDRGAQLVVIGSRRPRFGRSVACAVARAADRPVVIAARHATRVASPWAAEVKRRRTAARAAMLQA